MALLTSASIRSFSTPEHDLSPDLANATRRRLSSTRDSASFSISTTFRNVQTGVPLGSSCQYSFPAHAKTVELRRARTRLGARRNRVFIGDYIVCVPNPRKGIKQIFPIVSPQNTTESVGRSFLDSMGLIAV